MDKRRCSRDCLRNPVGRRGGIVVIATEQPLLAAVRLGHGLALPVAGFGLKHADHWWPLYQTCFVEHGLVAPVALLPVAKQYVLARLRLQLSSLILALLYPSSSTAQSSNNFFFHRSSRQLSRHPSAAKKNTGNS